MNRRPALLAVDLVGAIHIVGTLIAYLGLATLVPAAVALGYGEPVWPFLASGASRAGSAARSRWRRGATTGSTSARASSSSR